jgi:3-mercaptopropionate dioxygenase
MEGDEYLLDTPQVREFIAGVRDEIGRARSPREACDAIRPAFAALLADPAWLPERYQEGDPESAMGGGIGQWLLFRAGDRSLTLFALVVPPAAETPVHDHLAWGLVGLYRGTQDEEIYAKGNGGLELVERRSLAPGAFYALIPPRDDIHRVRTTSAETSVSLHLLTNDTGCVWRHAYDAKSGEARPFRSGYVNVACDPE